MNKKVLFRLIMPGSHQSDNFSLEEEIGSAALPNDLKATDDKDDKKEPSISS